MLIEFANKRVVVAGAARGIGRAITKAFAERGGQVHAFDLLVDDIKPLAGAAAYGGVVHTGAIDVTDRPSVEAAMLMAAGDAAVDVLVYVAGGVRGQSARPL